MTQKQTDKNNPIPDEIADLQEYAKKGEKPPLCLRYRIRIDGEKYVINNPEPTGREILELANLTPPENYTLRVKVSGEPPKKIGLDEKIDLRYPGVEKFKSLPRDQTEGFNSRSQCSLPQEDELFLKQFGLPWETVIDGSQWVLIHDFPTHQGYNYQKVSIAVRLENGYPLTPLDMVYAYPALMRNDGKQIPQTQEIQSLDGKNWQRWSRHRTAQNPWKPGEDSLESHLFLIQDWFVREFER